MTTIPDERLFESHERVKDRVVLITGGANGIGRLTALKFAIHGAKVVIGDRDIPGANEVVSSIIQNGGQAVSTRCDVTNFDDLVSLYEFGLKEYGTIDIVIVNAGVTETGQFQTVTLKDGKPVKPNMTTLDVNLYGLMYTVHLAQHYLNLTRTPNDLKAVVFLGSMASWKAIPRGVLYSASKHAALGTMRSLHPGLAAQNIRISTIHPFFANTAIVPARVKLFLAGIPKTPVERIAGAIFFAVSDPSEESDGSAFLLTHDGPVLRVEKEDFKEGVYKMIDERTNRIIKGVQGIAFYARFVGDVFSILRKPLLAVFVGVVSVWAWNSFRTVV